MNTDASILVYKFRPIWFQYVHKVYTTAITFLA